MVGIEEVVYFSGWRDIPRSISGDKNRYQTVKYKRNAFSHEEEVRFIIHPQDITGGQDYHEESHINLPIDVTSFIEPIEIYPRLPLLLRI